MMKRSDHVYAKKPSPRKKITRWCSGNILIALARHLIAGKLPRFPAAILSSVPVINTLQCNVQRLTSRMLDWGKTFSFAPLTQRVIGVFVSCASNLVSCIIGVQVTCASNPALDPSTPTKGRLPKSLWTWHHVQPFGLQFWGVFWKSKKHPLDWNKWFILLLSRLCSEKETTTSRETKKQEAEILIHFLIQTIPPYITPHLKMPLHPWPPFRTWPQTRTNDPPQQCTASRGKSCKYAPRAKANFLTFYQPPTCIRLPGWPTSLNVQTPGGSQEGEGLQLWTLVPWFLAAYGGKPTMIWIAYTTSSFLEIKTQHSMVPLKLKIKKNTEIRISFAPSFLPQISVRSNRWFGRIVQQQCLYNVIDSQRK